MPASTANILIEQGADLLLQFPVVDSTGANVDLTAGAWHAKFQVHAVIGDGNPLLMLTDGPAGGLTLGVGLLSLWAPAAQTKAINTASLGQQLAPLLVAIDALSNPFFATGYQAPYALELTDPGGYVTRVLQGFAIITPEVCQ